MTAVLMIEYRPPTEAVSGYAEWKQVFDTDPVGRRAHVMRFTRMSAIGTTSC
jgi:hypothetical protein